MPITRTPMVDDDGSGTTGTIINNAWKQELYNQIDAAAGPWVAIPFNAGNYVGSSGTWTVTAANQADLQLALNVGARRGYIKFMIQGTTSLAVASTFLNITIPGLPAVASGVNANPFQFWWGSILSVGEVELTSTGLQLLRDISGQPWPVLTAGNTYFRGQIYFAY